MTSEKNLRNLKPIVSAVLIGIGLLCWYETFAGTLTWLHVILASDRSNLPGILSVLIAINNGLAAHHEPVLHCVLQHAMAVSWPLLFMAFGTVLSSEAAGNRPFVSEKKDCAVVE